jgi:hypothetical protein
MTSLDRAHPQRWTDQNIYKGVKQIEDFVLSLALYAAMLILGISTMIFTTKDANCLSKISVWS